MGACLCNHPVETRAGDDSTSRKAVAKTVPQKISIAIAVLNKDTKTRARVGSHTVDSFSTIAKSISSHSQYSNPLPVILDRSGAATRANPPSVPTPTGYTYTGAANTPSTLTATPSERPNKQHSHHHNQQHAALEYTKDASNPVFTSSSNLIIHARAVPHCNGKSTHLGVTPTHLSTTHMINSSPSQSHVHRPPSASQSVTHTNTLTVNTMTMPPSQSNSSHSSQHKSSIPHESTPNRLPPHSLHLVHSPGSQSLQIGLPHGTRASIEQSAHSSNQPDNSPATPDDESTAVAAPVAPSPELIPLSQRLSHDILRSLQNPTTPTPPSMPSRDVAVTSPLALLPGIMGSPHNDPDEEDSINDALTIGSDDDDDNTTDTDTNADTDADTDEGMDNTPAAIPRVITFDPDMDEYFDSTPLSPEAHHLKKLQFLSANKPRSTVLDLEFGASTINGSSNEYLDNDTTMVTLTATTTMAAPPLPAEQTPVAEGPQQKPLEFNMQSIIISQQMPPLDTILNEGNQQIVNLDDDDVSESISVPSSPQSDRASKCESKNELSGKIESKRRQTCSSSVAHDTKSMSSDFASESEDSDDDCDDDDDDFDDGEARIRISMDALNDDTPQFRTVSLPSAPLHIGDFEMSSLRIDVTNDSNRPSIIDSIRMPTPEAQILKSREQSILTQTTPVTFGTNTRHSGTLELYDRTPPPSNTATGQKQLRFEPKEISQTVMSLNWDNMSISSIHEESSPQIGHDIPKIHGLDDLKSIPYFFNPEHPLHPTDVALTLEREMSAEEGAISPPPPSMHPSLKTGCSGSSDSTLFSLYESQHHHLRTSTNDLAQRQNFDIIFEEDMDIADQRHATNNSSNSLTLSFHNQHGVSGWV